MNLTLFLLFSLFIVFINCDHVSIGLGKKHVLPTYKNLHRLSKEAGVSVPVWGNVWPVAIYWAFINVGSPAKNYPVALDTGSMTLDIVGPNCENCVTKPPNRVYVPSSSTSSKALHCQDSACPTWCVPGFACSFSNTYQTCDLSDPNAPCTISGYWYQDYVSFGNLTPVVCSFGAITYQTTNFNQFQNIDGLVGLIQTGTGSDPTDVFLSLYQSGSVKRNIFCLCLLMKQGKYSNGTMTLGGIDSTLYTGTMRYTPNTQQGSYYAMMLNGLTVFGQQITSVSTSSAILDSGTNVLLLPDPGFTSVYNSFLKACSRGAKLVGTCDVSFSNSLWNGACFNMTQSQINEYPNITLNIQNIDIVMPPSTYLNQFDPESPSPLLYCLGIRNTGTGGLTIIGDTSMSNYYVVFDNERGRIGWAPVTSNCGSQIV